MRRLLINIGDFPDFVPFSVHIAPLLVTPHIRDAHTFDVGPLLSTALWLQLETELDTVMPEFNPAEFASSEFLTTTVQAGWITPALAALWYDAVRPLLVCESARRMLLWHGAHVTANGVETISDVGHMPVSGATRTELRSDLQAKCSHYRARLTARLGPFAPLVSTCGPGRRRRPGAGGLTTYAL